MGSSPFALNKTLFLKIKKLLCYVIFSTLLRSICSARGNTGTRKLPPPPLQSERPGRPTLITSELPATVVTGSKVSLADHLDLRNLPLATTPGGKNFALKALHPSDHEIRSTRVPGSNRASVSVTCDMIHTLNLGANNRAQVNLVPNPIYPASVEIYDDGGHLVEREVFGNQAFGGGVEESPDYAWAQSFPSKASAYRVTAQSMTLELVAPALSNQGTITAGQYINAPQKFYAGSVFIGTDGVNIPAVVCAPTCLYGPPPREAVISLGTVAYTGQARDGLYMPLKLTDFRFQNAYSWQYPIESPFSTPTDPGIPLPSLTLSMRGHAGFPSYRGAVASGNIPSFPRDCGHNYGVAYVGGLADNVAIRLRIRQVVEIVPRPGTTYAPLVEAPLPPDETAIKMYFEVSGRCKDGYPSSYNSLGTLREIVMGIGRRLLPYAEPALALASKLPGIPGLVATSVNSALKSVRQGYAVAKKQNLKPEPFALPPYPSYPAPPPPVRGAPASRGKRRYLPPRRA